MNKQQSDQAEILDDVTRKAHRDKWNRTILGIAVFCGIASWILVYSLFPGRHTVLRVVLASLYVYAIERVLLLLREGLMTTYETQREINTAIIGILGLFGVIAVNVVCHFAQQMTGAQLNAYMMEYLRWGMVVVPVAVMGLGIWLQSQDPEARRQTLERRERGERSEFKTNARRDALHHPTMVATKTLIAEITAEAMAEEWIDEVRGELPAAVRARLDAKLQTRQQKTDTYFPTPAYLAQQAYATPQQGRATRPSVSAMAAETAETAETAALTFAVAADPDNPKPPHVGPNIEWVSKGVGWDCREVYYVGKQRRRRHLGHIGRELWADIRQTNDYDESQIAGYLSQWVQARRDQKAGTEADEIGGEETPKTLPRQGSK